MNFNALFFSYWNVGTYGKYPNSSEVMLNGEEKGQLTAAIQCCTLLHTVCVVTSQFVWNKVAVDVLGLNQINHFNASLLTWQWDAFSA